MKIPHGWTEDDATAWTEMYKAGRTGLDRPAEPQVVAAPTIALRFDEFPVGADQEVPNRFKLTAAPAENSCMIGDKAAAVTLSVYDSIVDGQDLRLTENGWALLKFLHGRRLLVSVVIKYAVRGEPQLVS